jgi:hypothetical protein
MNKNLYRLTGGFVVLLGLAYLGHQVFVHDADPSAASTTATATAAAPAVALAAANNAYAVYPDTATQSALGLSYPTFNGDFVHGVVVTPLPPNFPGATSLRVNAQNGHKIDIGLTDTRCAARIHVAVSKINDRHAIESRDLDAATPKFSIPFADGKMPPLLIEMTLDEKAPNNYFCGVNVAWSQ